MIPDIFLSIQLLSSSERFVLASLGDTSTCGHSPLCVYVCGYWYAFLFIICRHFTNNGSCVCFLSSPFLNGNDNLKIFCRNRSSLVEKFHCVLWGWSLGHVIPWKDWHWKGRDISFGSAELPSCGRWAKLVTMEAEYRVQWGKHSRAANVRKDVNKKYKEQWRRLDDHALYQPIFSHGYVEGKINSLVFWVPPPLWLLLFVIFAFIRLLLYTPA